MSIAARTGVIHVHSDYSHDCRDSLERLREFALEHDLGFVALTDHAEDLDQRRFDEYVANCRALSDQRVRLIPGLEFRFDGFPGLHLLAIGVRRWITPRTPDEFVLARDAAAFTVVAHPVLFGYRLPASIAGGIDAIEIWNASYNTRYLPDPRAIRMLRAVRRSRPDVVGTVGLDQHASRNYRQTRVIVNDPRIDPLIALKTGGFTNAARTMTLSSTVDWDPVRLVGLTALRWAFDRVERVHDRLARRTIGRRLRAAGRPLT
jgi:hypothetical protein